LILDRENGPAIVRERLDRLGIERTTNLHVWGGWCDEQAPGPTDDRVVEFARRKRPLIICDSLVAFHPGKEQDATETRRFLDGFRRLGYLGAAVCLIHHTGKGDQSQDYRGSSDFIAAVDAAFTLEAIDGGLTIGKLKLRCIKSRMTPGRTLLLDYNEDSGFALSDDPLAAERNAARASVEEIVRDNPDIEKTALEAAVKGKCSCTRTKCRDAIAWAVEQGRVHVATGPHNRQTYRLASAENGH